MIYTCNECQKSVSVLYKYIMSPDEYRILCAECCDKLFSDEAKQLREPKRK